MSRSRYANSPKFFLQFGRRVRQLRQEQALTQEDMMEHGFGYRFYQRIEAGKPIHFRTVLKLADVFDVTLHQLFQGL